jgi:pimeloyl-ACP methyl ester carboxylesterase
MAGLGALTWALPALGDTPGSAELVQHDLTLQGDRKIARRALLLLPKHGTTDRLLVLLHGLGEAGNETLGIHAWGERYGLVTSYDRLRSPPIDRTLSRQRYLTDDHLAQLNATLSQQPFRGLGLLCPVTPNPYRAGSARQVLDRYADWIDQTLLPEAATHLGMGLDSIRVGIDGCSMGGYVAIEVFLRKPGRFRTLGGVQAAIGTTTAERYARQLAETIRRVGPRSLRFGTSSGDPYRASNQALCRHLGSLGVPAELSLLPGPHSQPWLREIGTLDMLLWHDRQI